MFLFSLQNPGTLTTGPGAPIGIKTAIQTVGERGPALLQDVNYLDEMAHFDRERIPGMFSVPFVKIIILHVVCFDNTFD